MTFDLDALLRRSDPYPATAKSFADQPLDARARRELAQLKSLAKTNRSLWARPVLVVCVTIACIGLVLGLTARTAPTALASAATPSLLNVETNTGSDPADSLRRIADAAAASVDEPQSPSVTQWNEWALSTRIDGRQVTSAIIPRTVERSHYPDGSGSIKIVTGEPVFPSKEYQEAWEADGQPGNAGTVVDDETFGSGQFVGMFPTPPPVEDAALASYLRVGHPIDEIGTAELFIAIADLRREWKLNPEQRAAVVRQISAAPDVLLLGQVEDRLGRVGSAFAVDSDYSGLLTRYILIIDDAGHVLSHEQVLTTTAGELGVSIPSVISYTVWPIDT